MPQDRPHDLFADYRERVILALRDLAREGSIPEPAREDSITLEPPRSSAHGDMASNAAMALAKEAKTAPRDLAALISPALERLEGVERVRVAGAGFLNLELSEGVWRAEIPKILAMKGDYGSAALGAGKSVSIEYVSANPTGPLHIGHARGAVFGDALARLMEKTGYSVTREYYVNDSGAQSEALARSVLMRMREDLGEIEAMPLSEDLYPGEYLIPVAKEILARRGGKIEEETQGFMDSLRQESVAAMMRLIGEDLKALGVAHDFFAHESELMERGAVEKAAAILEERGYLYAGELAPPKGKRPDDWKPRPQTLFRATAFGDETDRPLRKKDGSWTYFASDIAYHQDKISRGFDEIINVWGADHGGYVKRLAAALEALGSSATFTVKLCHMVRVLRDGKPVKMSKRGGGFIALRDVLKETGRDAFAFQMLTRKNDAPLDFDMKRVMEQAQDNPVFYVQYAHARICSVMRNAEAAGLNEADMEKAGRAPEALSCLALLAHDSERRLIKMLARFPRHVALASAMREPHRIAFYLHDLAALFHALWNVGKDDPQQRFLLDFEDSAQRDKSMARLLLLRATRIVLAEGLRILGVAPVEEMR